VLFVKLRALREISVAVKVFDFEDFGKLAAIQRIPKSGEDGSLYAKDAAHSFGSKRQGAVLDECL